VRGKAVSRPLLKHHQSEWAWRTSASATRRRRDITTEKEEEEEEEEEEQEDSDEEGAEDEGVEESRDRILIDYGGGFSRSAGGLYFSAFKMRFCKN
jgi:hypothetical protein